MCYIYYNYWRLYNGPFDDGYITKIGFVIGDSNPSTIMKHNLADFVKDKSGKSIYDHCNDMHMYYPKSKMLLESKTLRVSCPA